MKGCRVRRKKYCVSGQWVFPELSKRFFLRVKERLAFITGENIFPASIKYVVIMTLCASIILNLVTKFADLIE